MKSGDRYTPSLIASASFIIHVSFYIIIQEPLCSVCLGNHKLVVTRDRGDCIYCLHRLTFLH